MTEKDRNNKEKEALEKGLLQFRSFDKYLRNTLINNEIIFGAAKNFNDPFDCNLPIDLNNTKEEIYDYLNLANKKSKFNQEYIQNLAQHYFDNKDKLEKEIRFLIYDFRRFSCFHININNEAHANSLFWANYANKHQGICMKFNGKLSHPKNQFEKEVKPLLIRYCKKIPEFNYLKYRITKDVDTLKLYDMGPSQYFLGIKSKNWKNEKELRLVYKSPNELPIMEDYKNIKFNPKMLERVYLGCNASQTTVDELNRIMHLPKYKHVELIQLVRNNRKFKFNEVRIK